ncbi:MAG: hypothetical protein AB7D57_10600 [Desulfovibrionaceae bacterium]
MSRTDTSSFIQKKVEVQDPGAERIHAGAARPEGTLARSAYLVGPDGVGKAELAGQLSKRLGLPVLEPADAQALLEAEGPVLAVVRPALFRDPAVHLELMRRGRVLCLLPDPFAPAAPVPTEDMPLYMTHVHFVLPGGRGKAERFKDALEKLSL